MYTVSIEKNIFDQYPELKGVEEFSKLSDKEMKFVILCNSYRSPYRTMKEADKRRVVALSLFGNTNTGRLNKDGVEAVSGASEAIMAAEKKFKAIVHDIDLESLVAYDNQIREFLDLMNKKDKSPEDLDMVLKIVKVLPDLLEEKAKLMKKFSVNQDDIESHEDSVVKNMSTLDRYIMQKK